MHFLSVSDIFWSGMCIFCQYKTVSGQVCVLCVSIRQFLDRLVYCLSVSDRYMDCLPVSDSFWSGMCIVCPYQTGMCMSVSISLVFCLSVSGMCIVCQYQTGMCFACQYQTVSGQVCVLTANIRQFRDICLNITEKLFTGTLNHNKNKNKSLGTGFNIVCQYQTGIYIVCQYQTVSGLVCVLSVSIRQFLDRYVYCLSVSDSFWTGLCIVCQRQSGQVGVLCVGISQVCVLSVSISLECVFSVNIRLFLDRYVYFLSV